MSEYLNFTYCASIIEEYVDSQTGDPLLALGPIKKMNVFIGANNSRKSRLIRKLLEIEKFSFTVNLNSLLRRIKDDVAFITEVISLRSILKYNLRQVVDSPHYFNDSGSGFLKLIADRKMNHELDINSSFLTETLNNINTEFEELAQTALKSYDDNESYPILKSEMDKAILIIEFIFDVKRKSFSLPRQVANLYSKMDLDYNAFDEIEDKLRSIQKLLLELQKLSAKFSSHNRIYVPILRNAIRLYNKKDEQSKIIETDIYKTTIAEFYKLNETKESDSDNKLKIFTGLDFYNEIKTARNSRKPIRENFTAFENFVSASFFQNKEIDIVALDDNSEDTNHIYIYFDGDKDKQLHHLGDGIQALLILVYPIFMADAESWVFLEEPEINMHPGLLRLFIKTILEDRFIGNKHLRFFITTHSNHLLDLSLEHPDDVSVFSFKPSPEKDENTSIVQPLTGISNTILNDLGVKNSSLFMANCSIWVEGPTDRKILKAFLEAYCRFNNKSKLFLEDLHYCFIQYGGSTIANYVFGDSSEDTGLDDDKIKAAFISNKIILIADQDSNGPKAVGKQKGHKLLEKIAIESDNFTYHTTVANEVENLFSPRILARVANHILLKSKNDPVAKSLFKYSDYKSKNIGEYLFELLDEGNTYKFIDGKKLKTEYKNKIADFIVKSVNNNAIKWEDIKRNSAAANLIEKIYEQIKIYNLMV